MVKGLLFLVLTPLQDSSILSFLLLLGFCFLCYNLTIISYIFFPISFRHIGLHYIFLHQVVFSCAFFHGVAFWYNACLCLVAFSNVLHRVALSVEIGILFTASYDPFGVGFFFVKNLFILKDTDLGRLFSL